MRVEKLEVPMPAATPCKLQCETYRETCRTVEEHRTKYACIVEAAGNAWKDLLARIMKIIVQEFIEPLQSCAQICSYASSNETTRCYGSSGERMGKTRENTGKAADESQKQKRGDRKLHFTSLMDICHLKKSELEPQFQRYKDQVVFRGDIVAESKPTMNLVSPVSTSSSTWQSPIASKSPGILKALCRTDWSITGTPEAKEHNQNAASSSQG